MNVNRPQLNRFESFIKLLDSKSKYTKSDLCVPELRLFHSPPLEIYYAPFDYVNCEARVVIVGITPGFQQMELAIRTAREGLLAGDSYDDILREVKRGSSFAGPMRRNLISMLDDLGLPDQLGLEGSEDLFGRRRDLLHTTSAVRCPVFKNGKNHSGSSPSVTEHPELRRYVETVLADELASIPSALILPLGRAASSAVRHLADTGRLDHSRVCYDFPHPSGANGHRRRQFREGKLAMRETIKRWFSTETRLSKRKVVRRKSTNTEISKLATHLALAAVHGGVAGEVVALLTGTKPTTAGEKLKAHAGSVSSTIQEDERVSSSGSSGSNEAEPDEDLSSLIKEIADRMAATRARKKPGS